MKRLRTFGWYFLCTMISIYSMQDNSIIEPKILYSQIPEKIIENFEKTCLLKEVNEADTYNEKDQIFRTVKQAAKETLGIKKFKPLIPIISSLIENPSTAKIPKEDVNKAVEIFMVLDYLSLDSDQKAIIAERYIDEGIVDLIKKEEKKMPHYSTALQNIEQSVVAVIAVLKRPDFENIDFKNIKELVLTDQGLDSLYDFPWKLFVNLESLDCSYNKLRETFLSILYKCGLKNIFLHHNRIEKISGSDLSNLRKGGILTLNNNKISDFPDIHLPWNEDCAIDLRNNPFESNALSKIKAATQLTTLQRLWGNFRFPLISTSLPIVFGLAIPFILFYPYEQDFYLNFYDVFLNCFLASYLGNKYFCDTGTDLINWPVLRKRLYEDFMESMIKKGLWSDTLVRLLKEGTDEYIKKLVASGIPINFNTTIGCDNSFAQRSMGVSFYNKFKKGFDDMCPIESSGYPEDYSYIRNPLLQPSLSECYIKNKPYTIETSLANVSNTDLFVTTNQCDNYSTLPHYVLPIILVSYTLISFFWIRMISRRIKPYKQCVVHFDSQQTL
jgi:Leucine-rich repeat (LRR) protein